MTLMKLPLSSVITQPDKCNGSLRHTFSGVTFPTFTFSGVTFEALKAVSINPYFS